MALEYPLLENISLLASKLETTNGTEISVAGSDADMIVYNAVMAPNDATNERIMPAALGQNKSFPAARSGTLTFDMQWHGLGSAGAVPAWADRLFPACNLTKTSTTFGYASSSQTNTFALYENGLKRVLYGAKGSVKILYVPGEPLLLSFNFLGKYKAHADASILAPTFPSVLPPIVASGTLTLASYTPIVSRIEIDLGNELYMRPDGTGDCGGLRSCCIPQCKPMMTLDPEASLVASRDWFANFLASTEETLAMVVGATANNICTIASTTAQARIPKRGTRNGVLTDAIEIQLNSATPLTMAFS